MLYPLQIHSPPFSTSPWLCKTGPVDYIKRTCLAYWAEAGKNDRDPCNRWDDREVGYYSPGPFPVKPNASHHSLSLQVPFIFPSLCHFGCRASAILQLLALDSFMVTHPLSIPLQIHCSINKPSLDYLSSIVSSASQ